MKLLFPKLFLCFDMSQTVFDFLPFFPDSKEVHTATMRIPVFLNLGIAGTQQ